jgi:hypothetical protein
VELVEDDDADARDDLRVGQQQRAHDFGRHHDDGRVGLFDAVTGHETDGDAEGARQVGALLVRQRFERCRVDGCLAARQGSANGVLGDDGFPRARGRADDYRATGVEMIEGDALIRVKDEWRCGQRERFLSRSVGLRRSCSWLHLLWCVVVGP